MSSVYFPSPMALALAQAELAASLEEVPIGAVIVHENQVIAATHNLVITTHDPTAHAEILALRQASQYLKTSYLVNCDLYVTLEPCAMCAQAIAWARVRRLIFGAYDPKSGAVIHGPRLFSQPTCHHRPEVIGGIEEQLCQRQLRHFFQNLR
ncbi:MAG: nucleoside deaminase [Janthinobacterium lividum]